MLPNYHSSKHTQNFRRRDMKMPEQQGAHNRDYSPASL